MDFLYDYIQSKECDVNVLQGLLCQETGIDVLCDFKNTLLHAAVYNQYSNIDVVRFLLKLGINPNNKNAMGDTALHCCLQNKWCNLEIVKELFLHGADVTVISNYLTPLDFAIRNYSCGLSFIKELLQHDEFGVNIIGFRSKSPLAEALILQREVSIIEELLNYGAKLKSNDASTVLHFATSKFCCSTELVNLMVSRGVNINAKNNKGQTPLHCVFKFYIVNYDVVRALLHHKADISIIDSMGNSPLHYAVENKNLGVEFLKELLSMKINIEECICKSAKSKNILSLCILNKNYDYVFVLLKYIALKYLPIYILRNQCFNHELRLIEVLQNCINEVEVMQHDEIIKSITFYDVMSKDFSKLTNKKCLLFKNMVIKKVIDRLNSNHYPNYKDFILYLSKDDLVQYLDSFQVYSWKRESSNYEKISLDFWSKTYMAKFLSKQDLINLSFAYVDKLNIFKGKMKLAEEKRSEMNIKIAFSRKAKIPKRFRNENPTDLVKDRRSKRNATKTVKQALRRSTRIQKAPIRFGTWCYNTFKD